jgi:sugar diacid utilization regulator
MSTNEADCTLGGVLAELGASTVGSEEPQLSRRVRAALIWLPGDPIPQDPNLLIVCPTLGYADNLDSIDALLAGSAPRMIVVPAPLAISAEQIRETAGVHYIHALDVITNAADIVATVTRSVEPAEESISRRLASLQRSFSQALAEQSPIPALLNRVKRVTNAAVTLIDARGEAVHTTAPIPRAMLYQEIRRTNAESQAIDIDGWRGIATRVSDPAEPDQHFGWLMAVSRRTDFPNPYSISAVHIAAALIETNRQMVSIARSQERAVRATVFREALALRPQRSDSALAGRITSLGISFERELRVIVVRPIRTPPKSQDRSDLLDLSARLERTFKTIGLIPLVTTHDDVLALLSQCSAATAHRLFIAHTRALPPVHIGIGRNVDDVGDIADSYNDAQLAVRALRRRSQGAGTMTYEDFDFATRLFADVGLDKIAARAEEFLRPVAGREALAEGLRTYFEHGQNINAAADALNIHHNSLRYRLSKIEEVLNLNLKEPAAVASAFLALTALDLSQPPTTRPRASGAKRRIDHANDTQIDGPVTVTAFPSPDAESFGVVRGSDD